MAEIKCKMVGCDYVEYDSKLQANICTYGPMCKILVLEEEIDYLKKQLKAFYEAVDKYLKAECMTYSHVTAYRELIQEHFQIDADKIFGGE